MAIGTATNVATKHSLKKAWRATTRKHTWLSTGSATNVVTRLQPKQVCPDTNRMNTLIQWCQACRPQVLNRKKKGPIKRRPVPSGQHRNVEKVDAIIAKKFLFTGLT